MTVSIRTGESPGGNGFAGSIVPSNAGNRSIWALCLPKSLTGLDETDFLRTVRLISSYSISMISNPSMALRSTAALVFIWGAALASLNAQQALSGPSEAGEFQKLDPALKFLRTRNSRDYAVTTPNGIDEANYVKIGGLEQWITIRGHRS